MSDIGMSTQFWVNFEILILSSFLFIFIPGFYLPLWFFCKKTKINKLLSWVLSILLGLFIVYLGYLSLITGFIRFQIKNVFIEFLINNLYSIVILEILFVIVHFFFFLNRKKKR